MRKHWQRKASVAGLNGLARGLSLPGSLFRTGRHELADAVRDVAWDHHAVLLANHGPVVAGSSPLAASDAIEELEATARLHLLLRGQPCRCLTDDQINELKQR